MVLASLSDHDELVISNWAKFICFWDLTFALLCFGNQSLESKVGKCIKYVTFSQNVLKCSIWNTPMISTVYFQLALIVVYNNLIIVVLYEGHLGPKQRSLIGFPSLKCQGGCVNR